VKIYRPYTFLYQVTTDSVNHELTQIYDALEAYKPLVTVEGISAANAGDPFSVSHSLGVVPVNLFGTPAAQADVWFTDADKLSWTDKTVTLRSDAVNTKVTVTVVAGT
jgi:hypothetical protein